jgi:hypothetical protein
MTRAALLAITLVFANWFAAAWVDGIAKAAHDAVQGDMRP